MEIAGGRYAIVLHVGPWAELHRAYTFLFRVPRSGEEAADRPFVEEYLNNPREAPAAELETEVGFPSAIAEPKTAGRERGRGGADR